MSKENIWALLATALPGGYRVLGVFAFTQILPAERGVEFSTYYFWLGLVSSFTAFPLASLCYSKNFTPTRLQIVTSIVLSSVCSTTIVSFISSLRSELFFLNILVATILMAIFEVERTKLAVEGEFRNLSLALVLSCLLLFPAILLIDRFVGLEAIFFAILLYVPMAIVGLFSPKLQHPSFNWRKLIGGYLRFSIASSLSTGLMFLLPLILIQEFGESSATSMARVFVFSGIFFLIPRTLCAKAVPALRVGEIDHNGIKRLFIFIFITSLFLFAVCLVFGTIWFSEILVFLPLVICLLSTQFALPFSNVLMVGGRSQSLLVVNFYSALLFVLLVSLVFILFDQGVTRAIIICIVFTISNLLKALLTSRKAQELLDN